MRKSALTAFVLLTIANWAAAQELPAEMEALKFDQRLGEQVPMDAEFRDSDGQTVRFGDLMDDKPVVLVLAYYRCPRLCSMVIRNVIEGLVRIPPEAGKDFQVVVLSFDPNETPELAAKNKASAALFYSRGPKGAPGWRFLTGEEEQIQRVAAAVGFHYKYDPATSAYKHSAGIMILTPEGKVARYLFGISFNPQDLRLALVEASKGRIGAPADQALLLTCMAYDPASGTYTLSVLKIVRLVSIATILLLGLYIWWNLSRERRQRRKNLDLITH
jgi:protein SCO1/2